MTVENLYNNYKEMFDKYSKMQREVYELMFQNGWYVLEKSEIFIILYDGNKSFTSSYKSSLRNISSSLKENS